MKENDQLRLYELIEQRRLVDKASNQYLFTQVLAAFMAIVGLQLAYYGIAATGFFILFIYYIAVHYAERLKKKITKEIQELIEW
jgi:hypothetical protein